MNTPASLAITGFREHDARIRYFVKGAPLQNFGDYLPELLAKTFFLHPRVDADVYRVIGSGSGATCAAASASSAAASHSGAAASATHGRSIRPPARCAASSVCAAR